MADHFDTPKQQYDSAKLGMWIFLMTKVLFFGGLFCGPTPFSARTVRRSSSNGYHFLDKPLGACQHGRADLQQLDDGSGGPRGTTRPIAARSSACCPLRSSAGLAFLGVKGVEYKHKWDHQMVPGQARIEYWFSRDAAAEPHKKFRPDEAYVREHLAAEGFEKLSQAEYDQRVEHLGTFMSVYFSLTALHALHVIAGIGVIFLILVGAIRGRYGSQYFTPVDMVGLYWHLVDMIWIYLFPLLYLIH